MSIRTRISLLCTALTAILLLALSGVWLAQTRTGIHEETEAAHRVAQQWLTALNQHTMSDGEAVTFLHQLGRIRANELIAVDTQGQLRYQTPAATYKAGRQAPEWFSRLLQPSFATSVLPLATLTIHLSPNPSRATLDAWDDLCAMTGWAMLLLLLLFLATRHALDRTFHPLNDIMAALDKTAQGQFSVRLPLYPVRELHRLARSFNSMNDRLDEAIRENVQLQSQQAVAATLTRKLAEERQSISRELHDELAQSITAVRALAGTIARKGCNDPMLDTAAQSILSVTAAMQQDVRAILQKLRPPLDADGLVPAIERHLLQWQTHHPHLQVHFRLDGELSTTAITPPQNHALLRMVQEGLTNAARHANARNIWICLVVRDPDLQLTVRDDGRGLTADHGKPPTPGFGLVGLQERMASLSGGLQIGEGPEGGLSLQAWLPLPPRSTQSCSIGSGV